MKIIYYFQSLAALKSRSWEARPPWSLCATSDPRQRDLWTQEVWSVRPPPPKPSWPRFTAGQMVPRTRPAMTDWRRRAARTVPGIRNPSYPRAWAPCATVHRWTASGWASTPIATMRWPSSCCPPDWMRACRMPVPCTQWPNPSDWVAWDPVVSALPWRMWVKRLLWVFIS